MRWRTAFVAAVLVGRYDGQTRELAAALARDVDTVGQWAQAARTWLDLWRQFRVVSDLPACRARLRELRHCLTPSHFAAAGRLWRSHDLTAADVFAALDTAATNRASVREMAGYVTGSDGGVDYAAEWARAGDRYLRLAKAEASLLPEAARVHLRNAGVELARAAKAMEAR